MADADVDVVVNEVVWPLLLNALATCPRFVRCSRAFLKYYLI